MSLVRSVSSERRHSRQGEAKVTLITLRDDKYARSRRQLVTLTLVVALHALIGTSCYSAATHLGTSKCH